MKFMGATVDYDNYSALCRLRMKIGYVSPDCSLLSNMNLYDNLALFWRYHFKTDETELENKINSLLDSFEIREYSKLRPAQVDREFRKRAIYLREFLKEPELMILDKPSLDLSNEGLMLLTEALIRYRDESQGSIILNCDYRDFFSKITDNVLYLKDGKIDKTEIIEKS